MNVGVNREREREDEGTVDHCLDRIKSKIKIKFSKTSFTC